ncbi:MAG: hypothetical protein AB2A00_21110 [Myxococcota bacterium]
MPVPATSGPRNAPVPSTSGPRNAPVPSTSGPRRPVVSAPPVEEENPDHTVQVSLDSIRPPPPSARPPSGSAVLPKVAPVEREDSTVAVSAPLLPARPAAAVLPKAAPQEREDSTVMAGAPSSLFPDEEPFPQPQEPGDATMVGSFPPAPPAVLARKPVDDDPADSTRMAPAAPAVLSRPPVDEDPADSTRVVGTSPEPPRPAPAPPRQRPAPSRPPAPSLGAPPVMAPSPFDPRGEDEDIWAAPGTAPAQELPASANPSATMMLVQAASDAASLLLDEPAAKPARRAPAPPSPPADAQAPAPSSENAVPPTENAASPGFPVTVETVQVPAKTRRKLTTVQLGIVIGATLGLLVVVVGAVVMLRPAADASAGESAAPPPVLPEGPWTAHTLDAREQAATEKHNATVKDGVQVGPNLVAAALAEGVDKPDAPVVVLPLEGTDRHGEPQKVVLRLPSAQVIFKVAQQIHNELGLQLRVTEGWRSNGAHAELLRLAPALTSAPGDARHLVGAVDVSRQDASGKNPLTVGIDGKVIFLEDLSDEDGLERFRAVIRRIEQEEIKKAPRKVKEIVQGWVDSAREDYEAGVWGLADATMEIWRRNGWTVGHCGEVPTESFHAEPIRTVKTCERWNEAYNERIKRYRGSRPPSEGYLLRARDLALQAGPWEPYLMPPDEKEANDEVNADLPEDFMMIGFNRVSAKVAGKVDDPDALIVFLKLPGKDRSGKPQRPLGRMPTAEAVHKIAQDIQKELGLVVRANFLWRNNARQQQLRDATPKLAAKPGTSNHFVNAADISRVEATGKNPLTLGVEGKVIFLEDLQTEEGAERFREVIRRIEKDALKKAKSDKHRGKIVEAWVTSAKEDYDHGIWGLPDATMDIWRKHGWTISHCGEITYETWHAEPITKMKKCERWDDTYNKRIKAYRKKPPPDEDEVFTKVEEVLANPLPKKTAKKKKACKGINCQINKAIDDVKKLF